MTSLFHGIISGNRKRSHDEVAERTERIASGLQSLGVRQGDSVCMLLRNDIAFIESAYAAMRLGAYGVPINWHFKPEEINYVLKDSGTRVLIAHADMLHQLREAIPEGVTVLAVPTPPEILGSYKIDPDHLALPDFAIESWTGVLAPAGTPAPIVQRLNSEIVKILDRADVKQRLLDLGAVLLLLERQRHDPFFAIEDARAVLERGEHLLVALVRVRALDLAPLALAPLERAMDLGEHLGAIGEEIVQRDRRILQVLPRVRPALVVLLILERGHEAVVVLLDRAGPAEDVPQAGFIDAFDRVVRRDPDPVPQRPPSEVWRYVAGTVACDAFENLLE